MNILVLAAHPDDEVLGCGGTIAKLSEEGHEVNIAILGEGITSRYDKREDADEKLLEELQNKSINVSELLGAKGVSLFNLPDNRFDTVPLLDVVKIVETLVDDLQPEIVFTQHGGDLNIDHAILFRATMTATRPVKGMPVKKLYAYEVASSSEWALQQFDPIFKPNYFVNIGKHIEKKVLALATYESEAREYPHPRSPEALQSIAKRWGSLAGLEAAEAFQLIREIDG